MILHKYKAIFIHVPKTGGSSVNFALRPYCDEETHSKAHPLQSAYYNFCDADNYYQFSFVRNPFSRLVSSYNYLRQGGISQYDRDARDKLGLQEKTFEEFVKSFNPIDSAIHFKPQIKFFNKDINKVRIFKLENIQSDFNLICGKIGIPRQKLLRRNKSNHKHYTEYYDDETRKIVAEKYAKDIECFSYEFEE
mgnify:CR=1 FL=1